MLTRHAVTTAAGLFAVACATTTPGAGTHDMSGAQHSAAAEREDKEANVHLAQFDASAPQPEEHCHWLGSGLDGCWTSGADSTAEHLEAAKEHRRRAADHRAASLELRSAEAKACGDISPNDRDTSPFAHREDIAGVEPLVVQVAGGRGYHYPKTTGAIIRFRAIPGMTAEWLQRIVDCHIARNDSVGHDMPEMGYCPMGPKKVVAKVTPAPNGLLVSVSSEDPDSADEILRRAKALKP